MDILQGNNLELLKTLPDNSVDSVVTDPPYGLSFMNKKWDYDVPTEKLWREVYRVLKPGGHLLSFSGSRTYHRMTVRIEDAGFEIRDQIMWIYGSGFPKSHNVGKAVDKLLGNEREVVGIETTPYKVDGKENEGTTWDNKTFCSKTDENGYRINEITKGQSEWEGWGTALKPAHEPIVLARKPLSEKSVAENVLKWGTGGINIDDSRIGDTVETWPSSRSYSSKNTHFKYSEEEGITQKTGDVPNGRWPANIMFDEDAAEVLDEKSGNIKSTKFIEKNIIDNTFHANKKYSNERGYSDNGGASRFFYVAKSSKKDRDEGLDAFEDKERNTLIGQEIGTSFRENGTPILPSIVKNNHPTVKPTKLMEYLIRLITPKGGVVLDPFMGSGSTGKAAVRNGYDFIGMELDEEYIKIAKARINNELNG